MEVLIATSIIGIALAAIIRTAVSTTANLAYLEEKSFAHWVAINQLEELEAARTYPPLGRKTGSEEMAGREWYWSTEVKKTADPQIRRVDVSVSLEEGKRAPAVTMLTGFFSDNRKRSTPQ